jgi:hypothetical protein
MWYRVQNGWLINLESVNGIQDPYYDENNDVWLFDLAVTDIEGACVERQTEKEVRNEYEYLCGVLNIPIAMMNHRDIVRKPERPAMISRKE